MGGHRDGSARRSTSRTRGGRHGAAIPVVTMALLAGGLYLGSPTAGAVPQGLGVTPEAEVEVEPLCGHVLAPIQGVLTDEKVVAFTFDDGPGGLTTRRVVEAFEKRGARATFFLIGKMLDDSPSMPPREIVERGHEVGNHAWTHVRSGDRVAKDLLKNQAAIEAATGVRPVYFRMPHLGWTRKVLETSMAAGLCSIDTTVGLGDYLLPRIPGSELCRKFTKRLVPGAIVLLHDGYGHRQTADGVPCMLDYAIAQGYRIVSLRELLHMAGGDPAKLRLRKMPR